MDYKRLSKEISYALRHAPWEYNLKLDNQGFVDSITQEGLFDGMIDNKENEKLF